MADLTDEGGIYKFTKGHVSGSTGCKLKQIAMA